MDDTMKTKMQFGFSLLNNAVFLTVYSLYFFDVIGETKTDCYYVEGNHNAMTLKTANVAAKALKNKDIKPVNVTEKFDLIIMLGFITYVTIWIASIIVAVVKNPKVKSIMMLFTGLAVVGLGITNLVMIFMYRGTMMGDVCSGSYIKGTPTVS